MWRLTKQFRFEAAHSLDHMPKGHKCKGVHGHSYLVEVTLCHETLDHRGFAGGVDYADLDTIKSWIDARFDHKNLNDVFDSSVLTTAENLAKYIYDKCKEHWDVESVRVHETNKTCVEYREHEE